MYSADVIQLIVNTLKTVVWYKRDFYRILETSDVPKHVLEKALNECGGTNAPKIYVADSVVGQLNKMGEDGLGPLRKIVQQLINWRDFSAAADEKKARNMVESLRRAVAENDRDINEARAKMKAEQLRREEGIKTKREKSAKLMQLYEKYVSLLKVTEAQKRGYELERLLYELFSLFELRPGAPYKIVGEQIDGDFLLEGDNFLLEARWRENGPTSGELYEFQGKVERKFEGTRGLFISIMGFSTSCKTAFSTGKRPNMVLMDGEDLMYVLESRIDLPQLLSAKIRHASRTGIIDLRARDVMQ